MSSTTTASTTTDRVRVATVRVHGLSTLIARSVWIGTDQRAALEAIRLPIFPGDLDSEIARELEDRAAAILTPRRRDLGASVSVRPFALDRVMEHPATSAGAVGPADAVSGYLFFGEREVGVVRVAPDPDRAKTGDLLALADAVGVTS